MRSPLLLAGVALAVPLLAPEAQTVRWNDRPSATWQDEAPRVQVSIVGDRNVALGAPVLVRFETSDDAFVTVVRVDGEGRMTILYPESRRGRSAVKGGQVHYVRNGRLGYDASFVVTDRRVGGYVFALASYEPLDLSGFESRDFERFGSFSRFTQVNRTFAQRPDVFVDRFAASVLWDADTPYDFDVDYYYSMGQGTLLNAYALCGALSRYAYGPVYARSYQRYGWDSWDLLSTPYSGMCNSYYNDIRCFSLMSVFGSANCYSRAIITVVNAPVPSSPGDPGTVPNEGVVRGGLVTPTPLPVPVGNEADPPPLERRARFDEALRASAEDEWDSYLSIPARAIRKMKVTTSVQTGGTALKGGEAAKAGGSTAVRAGLDRVAGTGKPEKTPVAAAGSEAPARVPPPSREPTRTKTSTEPRRDVGTSSFGGSTSGSSRTGSSGGSSRPTSSGKTGGTSTPRTTPTVQGTGSSTTKTKPPTPM